MQMRFVLAMLSISVACFAQAGSPDKTYRKKLDQPQTIQGYPCARNYTWFYADGSLQRCFVSRETAFGEITVPKGSIINLLPDGRPQYAMLAHNTLLLGINCSGGGPLGPAEGAMTSLYPSGKLKTCFLAQDQLVQGIPCARGGFYRAMAGRDVPVEFYENGKLRSCLLSGNIGNLHSGDRFVQQP